MAQSPARGNMDSEVRKKLEKQKQKTYADDKRKARIKVVGPGDKVKVMIQQRKTTTQTPWDPKPFTVTKVKRSQVEVKRGGEIKRRALNLIKKIKLREGADKRETKKKEDEDPDIDITIEEIRRRIKEEREAAGVQSQDEENPGLDVCTDSDFTVSFEGVLGSPGQDTEEEGVRQDKDRSNDEGAPECSNDE